VMPGLLVPYPVGRQKAGDDATIKYN